MITLDKIQVFMAILFTHGCHDSELLLGAIVHHSGNWTTMIQDGKASIQVQLRNRINALKKICQFTDLKTRKPVASGLSQSKLPLYGAAPDYLLRGLQVQQMAAATAVLGNQKILSFLGWLNIKQQYASSTLILTHKIVTTGRPPNRLRSMVTPSLSIPNQEGNPT